MRAHVEQDRRTAILDATLRVLGREGPGGLTHRAVAAEADVPLAATTYYFSSKDELLLEALRRLVADEVADLEAQRAGLASLTDAVAVAGALAHVLEARFADPVDGLAKFDVYLEAARRSALRDEVRQWVGAFVDLAAGVLGDRDAAAAFVAAVDGLVLHELLLEEGVSASRLAPRIERLLNAFAP